MNCPVRHCSCCLNELQRRQVEVDQPFSFSKSSTARPEAPAPRDNVPYPTCVRHSRFRVQDGLYPDGGLRPSSSFVRSQSPSGQRSVGPEMVTAHGTQASFIGTLRSEPVGG